MPLKVIITGASGFIGKQLVPRLQKAGFQLLLVGRTPQILDNLFPGLENCAYCDLSDRGKGYDVIIHLAVLNNTALACADEFQRVNVGFLEETLAQAKRAGVGTLINVTTFHALFQNPSNYAKSKRSAVERLETETEIRVINAFLPAVYGDEFAGRLALVKRLPARLRPFGVQILAALAPTVHIDRLAEFVCHGLNTADRTVLLANAQDRNPVFVFGKRAVDFCFAFAVLLFGWWLLAAIWIAIRIESRGPGIFAQKRIGRNGIPFICYKFRTMKAGTRDMATHHVDPENLTRIGAFLRRTKIDELPQVWNILRGELSLVGPRPGLPMQTELYEEREKRGVFQVLPGITGLAQIKKIDMRDPARLAVMDARYIAQQSLVTDLKIMLATLLGRGMGDRIKH